MNEKTLTYLIEQMETIEFVARSAALSEKAPSHETLLANNKRIWAIAKEALNAV